MTENLKRCPFCGGKEVKLFKEGSIWVVECLQCLAKVGATAEADVLDFWNSRPIEDELHEKIEKLERENHILRLDLAEIARGFDVDGFDYTREGMMRISKEALKGENK